ncbi:DCTN3 [Acanthosepion pharaonis]|uniref:DCTN3 n=1 Tax=Acanthosepion pharaonis TaxID=158019 RepID=A0A812B0A7_ACAPH|nr:DCTN3 [Sepia pharaonis]
MAATIDILEERVKNLENLVFGSSDKDVECPKGKPANVKCVESLHNVHSKMMVSVAGHKNIAESFSKLAQIEKYLDPEYTDELTITQPAKLEMILAEENLIKQTASSMEELKCLEEVISSEHIKGTPFFSCKFKNTPSISAIHLCLLYLLYQHEKKNLLHVLNL